MFKVGGVICNKRMSMLRFSQEEQYRYFYIDRKFASGNLQQINEALDELALFLGKMTRTDLINSFIMRMLQLIPSCKALTLKHRIACIFHQHSQLLLASPSKEELANTLNKFVKNHDQTTRIVALQIVAHLSPLFLKDTALYHILLSKISGQNSLGKSQKKEAIVCLAQLLATSSHLAKLFSKNITDLQKVYEVPLHILLYLLTFPKIDSHRQIQVLRQVLVLFKDNRQKSSKNQLKLQTKYFQKVLLIYASTNYRIISLYYQSDLTSQLSKAESYLQKIQQMKYPFLKLPKQYQKRQQQNKLSTDNLIDLLYAKKTEGRLIQEYQKYKPMIYEAIENAIIKGRDVKSTEILLLYFVENNIEQYDQKIKQSISMHLIQCNKTLFKQLAVIGCYESALDVLNQHLQIPELNYLFLSAYLQFKIHKDRDMTELKEIATMISPELLNIVKGWELIDTILKLVQNSSWSAISKPQKQLKQVLCTLKQKSKLTVISQIFNIFVSSSQSDTLPILKKKCYPLLPSHIMTANNFWFAHLEKETFNYIMSLSL